MLTPDRDLPVLPDPPDDCCGSFARDPEAKWYLVRATRNKQGGTTVRAYSTHLAATSRQPTLREAIVAVYVWAPWARLRTNAATSYFLARARHFAAAESSYWQHFNLARAV